MPLNVTENFYWNHLYDMNVVGLFIIAELTQMDTVEVC